MTAPHRQGRTETARSSGSPSSPTAAASTSSTTEPTLSTCSTNRREVRHRRQARVGAARLPLLIAKLRSERSPSRSRLVVLVFQALFALAFVFAVSLVLLGVQDRGFV